MITLKYIIDELQEAITRFSEDIDETCPNSYGAGYDHGFLGGLRRALDLVRYENTRINYDTASDEHKADLQDHYDNVLSCYWEDIVLQEGEIHYDDVDAVAEAAWERYLEH